MTQTEIAAVRETVDAEFEGLCVECGEPIFADEGVDVGGHFTCRPCVEVLFAAGLLVEDA